MIADVHIQKMFKSLNVVTAALVANISVAQQRMNNMLYCSNIDENRIKQCSAARIIHSVVNNTVQHCHP